MTHMDTLFATSTTKDKAEDIATKVDAKDRAQNLLRQDTTNPMRRAFGVTNAITSNAVTWGAIASLINLQPKVISLDASVLTSFAIGLAFVVGTSIRNVERSACSHRAIDGDFAMATAKWEGDTKYPVARASVDGVLNGFKKSGIGFCVSAGTLASLFVVGMVGGTIDYVASWAKSLYLECKGKDAGQAKRSTFEDSFNKYFWENCPLFPNFYIRNNKKVVPTIAARLQERAAKAELKV